MSQGDPIGRLFNIVHAADDVYVSLRDAGAVTFVGHLTAGDTFTLTEATTAAGGSAAVLAKATSKNTVAVGGGTWTTTAQAAASTVVTSGAEVVTVTIRAEQLSDGFKYIKCASTSTGTVMAILHDLKVQRKPANLASVIV